MVERQIETLRVGGSIPSFRTKRDWYIGSALVFQTNDTSSILVFRSKIRLSSLMQSNGLISR